MTRTTRTVAVAAFALAAGSLVACAGPRPVIVAAPATPAPVTVTATPTPTPSLNGEAAYVQDLTLGSVIPAYGDAAAALRLGHSVCSGLATGESSATIRGQMTALPTAVSVQVLASAKLHLCPEYSGR